MIHWKKRRRIRLQKKNAKKIHETIDKLKDQANSISAYLKFSSVIIASDKGSSVKINLDNASKEAPGDYLKKLDLSPLKKSLFAKEFANVKNTVAKIK